MSCKSDRGWSKLASCQLYVSEKLHWPLFVLLHWTIIWVKCGTRRNVHWFFGCSRTNSCERKGGRKEERKGGGRNIGREGWMEGGIEGGREGEKVRKVFKHFYHPFSDGQTSRGSIYFWICWQLMLKTGISMTLPSCLKCWPRHPLLIRCDSLIYLVYQLWNTDTSN